MAWYPGYSQKSTQVLRELEDGRVMIICSSGQRQAIVCRSMFR